VKKRIFFADLTHTGIGINADVFPLGIGFVAAYAFQELGEQIEVRLFKFPDELNAAIKESPPDVLCCSSYAWNARLAYKFAEHVKKISPETITIFGGPDFPLPQDERKEFLAERPAIDFFIKWDGEHALVGLLRWLFSRGMEVNRLKADMVYMPNVCYVNHGQYVEGVNHRVENLMTIPSPYLAGLMDQFFEYPMMPNIETIRGCPYSCLRGDTLIDTIYGKIAIKELAETRESIPVYTYKDGNVFIADAINIRKTGRNKKMVRVNFDDDTHIDCTPDHRFLQFKWGNQHVRLREWMVEAQHLEPGSHVRAIKTVIGAQGYSYIVWGRRLRRHRSRVVMDYIKGRRLSRSEQVHHIDRNKQNDHPDNLEYHESAQSHINQHPELAQRMRDNNPAKNMTPEWRASSRHAVISFSP